MNYYGVGVKFGGTQEMLPLYLEKDCWFMGFRREEKPSFYETAQKVQPGDVMIAKAYATAAQAYYYVRAIGIVTDTKKPDTRPSEYDDRAGFSVTWIKYFEKPAALSAKKFARGTFHTKTIFLEKNPDLIAKIQEMMKYDYAGEPDETESFEEGIPEVSESTE